MTKLQKYINEQFIKRVIDNSLEHKAYISEVRKRAYKKNVGLQMLNLKRKQQAIEKKLKEVNHDDV
jgi:hypothetical protein